MNSTNINAVTLERILDRCNLYDACKQVKANKGAPGVDGMRVEELQPYIDGRDYPSQLTHAVLNGTYKPQPIKRVYIPKDNGEQRPLGIPTVQDRVIQQATAQVLTELYEPLFSDNSFGFRPGRGTQDAIERATEYVNSGLKWVIDLDLAKFFDTVNHSKLLQVLSNHISDERVISLIHKFLRATVSENGKIGQATVISTPQGGCISPILANILLNELDQNLEKRNIKFVRYADDMVVFCGSYRAAERILGNIKKFIEEKLFLRINETKTKIIRVSKEVQFLGFSYTNKTTAKRKKEEGKSSANLVSYCP
ncbi:MAG: group II intron reverse transcriptase/maturase [Desulfovibrionaceae bacterium]|nr:group II intron reverse transcriptase/maturase [Desulfovibrionaceae bacterium]